jgi:hypothetical protein
MERPDNVCSRTGVNGIPSSNVDVRESIVEPNLDGPCSFATTCTKG